MIRQVEAISVELNLGGNMQTDSIIFNIEDFKKLAHTHEPMCLSVFIPTHRSGEEVKEQHAQKTLKNILKEVKKEILNREMSENESDVYLRPLLALMEDNEFWTDQSDGLAIFMTPKSIQKYKVPIHFEPYFYLADHFYLKSMVPLINDDDLYYIITLSLNQVKLYECTTYTIAEIDTGDMPQKLEDVVGSEIKPGHLQQHSGKNNETGTMFHGQGGGKDDRQQDLLKFFREIDKTIADLVNTEQAPVVLACDKNHFGNYRNISKIKNLHSQFIAGNPEDMDLLELHNEASYLLVDEFRKEKQDRIAAFRQYSNTDIALAEIEEIVPAAVNGRVDTLFIQSKKETYGLFDQENSTIIIDRNKHLQNASLYNLAAVNTILNNGTVYLLDPANMPLDKTNANALLRY